MFWIYLFTLCNEMSACQEFSSLLYKQKFKYNSEKGHSYVHVNMFATYLKWRFCPGWRAAQAALSCVQGGVYSERVGPWAPDPTEWSCSTCWQRLHCIYLWKVSNTFINSMFLFFRHKYARTFWIVFFQWAYSAAWFFEYKYATNIQP